jgi:hypothetical protein
MTESMAILDRPKGGRSSLHRRMDKAVIPEFHTSAAASKGISSTGSGSIPTAESPSGGISSTRPFAVVAAGDVAF